MPAMLMRSPFFLKHLPPGISAIIAAFFCLHFTISTKHSPRQPVEGQLQLHSQISYSEILAGGQRHSQYGWRGNWELFASDELGLGGILQLPLHSPAQSRNDFIGIGANWHYLQLGDLDLSAGAYGLLTIVSVPPVRKSGAYGGALLELNALLIGDHFLYGVYYHIIGGIGYHISGFEHPDYNFDEIIYKVGIGWTI